MTASLFVSVISALLTSLLLADIPLIAHAVTIAMLSPTTPIFVDTTGNRLHSLGEGNQVMIITTFRNNIEEKVAFVGIVEVRDESGITVLLSWQVGNIEPSDNKTIGVSWLVQNSSAYQARTFAFTNFEHPQVLSPVENVEVSVTRQQ
jgi:hypothetical protein